MRGWIIAWHPGDHLRIGRTERSLAAAGLTSQIVTSWTQFGTLAEPLDEPVLLVEAGAWLVRGARLARPSSSATGRPLAAFGAVRGVLPFAEKWAQVLSTSGGDFDRARIPANEMPVPVCAWVEPKAARLLASASDWESGWRAVFGGSECRKVHVPGLDVAMFQGIRVLQVVTSLHVGGAERVTLDLARELPRYGVAAAVAALGRPGRVAFPTPRDFFDLSRHPAEPEARAAAIAAAAHTFGADLVHGHLLTRAETSAVRARGLPVAVTLHNLPPAWPEDFATLQAEEANLIFTCSRAVEAAAIAARLPVPIRTVWNGIAVTSPAAPELRRTIRRELGWALEDFVLLAMANPRRQKRLERLPKILERTQEHLSPRRVRLWIVGDAAAGSADGRQAVQDLEAAIAQCSCRESIRWRGAQTDIHAILAAADVLVSVSSFEGLSLAQLEALSAGLTVVATNVGGAGEIAAQTPALRLLPAAADENDFAAALAAVANESAERNPALPRSFTCAEMAARTASLYARLLASRAAPGDGVWLITNNFSTGGAQSSARRLLTSLATRGVKVRAAVVQEDPAEPTPGRAALLAAGLPVLAVPPPEVQDTGAAVAQLLAALDCDRPRAVIFWNLIPAYKLLLADALFEVPIFDVSPGEMYFASLERYFAAPRVGLPYPDARAYGTRLAGVVVKYDGEAERAAKTLGAPVHVIPNGVSRPPRAVRKPANGVFVIGTAARLSPDKRLGDLLEAIVRAEPRLPPFLVRVAGGEERGHERHAGVLREQARGLPVEWCGALPDIDDFLAGLDLFVAISEPAGCPNSLLEAMAAGVPVIATDVGGAREQVVDGVTGRLVAPRSSDELVRALVEVARDAGLRARFAKAAANRVASVFALSRMVERYAELCGLELQPRPAD